MITDYLKTESTFISQNYSEKKYLANIEYSLSVWWFTDKILIVLADIIYQN